jgi:hypothetical protein
MSFMPQQEKKAKQAAHTQPEVTDLQTQPEVTDLAGWENTEVRGTYVKKEANPKDSEKK